MRGGHGSPGGYKNFSSRQARGQKKQRGELARNCVISCFSQHHGALDARYTLLLLRGLLAVSLI